MPTSTRTAKRQTVPHNRLHTPSVVPATGRRDVCERRRWRMKRAIRSGSGQNSVSASEQRILGTATVGIVPYEVYRYNNFSIEKGPIGIDPFISPDKWHYANFVPCNGHSRAGVPRPASNPCRQGLRFPPLPWISG